MTDGQQILRKTSWYKMGQYSDLLS